MHRPRASLPAVGLAVASVLAFAVAPAAEQDPAPTPYLAEDAAGDANGLNGQGVQDVGSTSTDPAQVDAADILGARITSTWDTTRGADGLLDRTFTGAEFRTRLAAAPGPDSLPMLHRFIGTIDGCPVWVEFAAGGADHGTTTVDLQGSGCGVPDDPDTGLPGTATFSGPGIAWAWDAEHGEAVVTIDATVVEAQLADRIIDGASYELTELHVRHHSPTGLTAPVIDEMDGQGGTVHLGEDVPADQEPSDDDHGGGHTGGPGNDVPRDTTPLCGRYDGGTVGTTPTEGEDRTGAGPDTLTLGMHAPATGAAPLPTTSFERGSDLYWRAVTEDCGETVLGRDTMEVPFRDDKYDPNAAGQVCRELASESFLVVGGGGTDQVQRCGQLAEVQRFPYMSTGVTTAGLDGSSWYFASTMSFAEQGRLLAEYVATNPDDIDGLGPDARIGTIVTDTPNFDDALQGWQQGLADNGLESIVTVRHTKNDSSWISTTAREMKEQDVDVVFMLTAPTRYLDFAAAADTTYGYNPLYTGVASDTSLDAVLEAGCRGTGRRVDGAVWLSGTPGLDAAPTAFFEAAEIFDVPADDITLRMWAFAEQQRELLEGYEEVHGHDLTRQDFRAFVEGSNVTDGTFPNASWSDNDHFPSEAMHVVQANCEVEQHVTLHVDASGF